MTPGRAQGILQDLYEHGCRSDAEKEAMQIVIDTVKKHAGVSETREQVEQADQVKPETNEIPIVELDDSNSDNRYPIEKLGNLSAMTIITVCRNSKCDRCAFRWNERGCAFGRPFAWDYSEWQKNRI